VADEPDGTRRGADPRRAARRAVRARRGGRRLRLTAGTGWEEGALGRHEEAERASTPAAVALRDDDAVVFDDIDADRRFTEDELLRRHGVVSGLAVGIRGRSRGIGALAVYGREARSFSPREISFLRAVANVLATAQERVSAERETQRRALHDALTGLANRPRFLDRLEHALSELPRRESTVGVLFLDLDDFKAVNDTYGHPAGDRLLVAVADRLSEVVREPDTLARFGGDEFALLIEDLTDEEDAGLVAQRLTDALKAPFRVGGADHFVSTSIGIALAEGENVTAETMLRNADVAMYRRRSAVARRTRSSTRSSTTACARACSSRARCGPRSSATRCTSPTSRSSTCSTARSALLFLHLVLPNPPFVFLTQYN
jgi:diguanylate cyclase (GGDEF)-like protein